MNHKLLFQRNTNIHKSIKFEVRLPAHTDSCNLLLTLQMEQEYFTIPTFKTGVKWKKPNSFVTHKTFQRQGSTEQQM